jgi:lipopolysaccharide export system protein LptA
MYEVYMRQRNNVIALMLLAIPAIAPAKTSDAEQPIYIEADQVEIRDREGLSIYRGNVRIVQGSLRINGDEIQFRTSDQGFQKVRILGKPANFFQLTDNNQEISAQGEEMEYQAHTGILTLNRNAVLVQQDNRFTSEHIVYNTQTNVVKAGVSNNNPQVTPPRVTITVMPEKPKADNAAVDAPQTEQQP